MQNLDKFRKWQLFSLVDITLEINNDNIQHCKKNIDFSLRTVPIVTKFSTFRYIVV